MSAYDQLRDQLKASPKTWLVTGVAGFIGSNLLETLLRWDQNVVGLDNFSTGKQKNLEEVRGLVSTEQWARFRFVEGNICDAPTCLRVCSGVNYILHEAAIGSVPRSLLDPVASHEPNLTGFVHMLAGARAAKVERFVYASSSAVYGDDPNLPKVENRIGRPLSPYAAMKWMNEVYAEIFGRVYGLESIGLRYFNVFGPRQDPLSGYAAVVPKWMSAIKGGRAVEINGDGETSRDFCYVPDVVQATLLAAVPPGGSAAVNQVYNVAEGERTTLNELREIIGTALRERDPNLPDIPPVYRAFRPGDVRHSMADVSKAKQLLGYVPRYHVREGMALARDWYWNNLG